MSDEGKKIIIGVNLDSTDFQSLMERLRQLEQTAKKVADSFATIKTGTGSAPGTGGAAMPGVPTAATVASGMGSSGDPEITRIQLLKRSYEELTTVLSRYRSERDALGRGGAGPTTPSASGGRPIDTMSVATPSGGARGPAYNAFEAQTVNINAQIVNINGSVSGTIGAGGGGGAGAGGGGGGGGGGAGAGGGGGINLDAIAVAGTKGSFEKQALSMAQFHGIERVAQGIENAIETNFETNLRLNMLPMTSAAGAQTYRSAVLGAALSGDMGTAYAISQMGGYTNIYNKFGMKGTLTNREYGRAAWGVAKIGLGIAAGAIAGAATTATAAAAPETFGASLALAPATLAGMAVSGGLMYSGYDTIRNSVSNIYYDLPEKEAQQRVLAQIENYKKAHPEQQAAIDAYTQSIPDVVRQSRRFNFLTGVFDHGVSTTGTYMQERAYFASRGMDPTQSIDQMLSYANFMNPEQALEYTKKSGQAEKLGYDPKLSVSLSQLAAKSAGLYGVGGMSPIHRSSVSEFTTDILARSMEYFGRDLSGNAVSLLGNISASMPSGDMSLMGYQGILKMMQSGSPVVTAAEMETRARALGGLSHTSKNPLTQIYKLQHAENLAKRLGVRISHDQALKIAEMSGAQFMDLNLIQSQTGLDSSNAKVQQLAQGMFKYEPQVLLGGIGASDILSSIQKSSGVKSGGDIMTAYQAATPAQKRELALRLSTLYPQSLPTTESAFQLLESFRFGTSMDPSSVKAMRTGQEAAIETTKRQLRTETATGIGEGSAEEARVKFLLGREGAITTGQQEMAAQLSNVLSQLGASVQSFEQAVQAAQANVASMGGASGLMVAPTPTGK